MSKTRDKKSGLNNGGIIIPDRLKTQLEGYDDLVPVYLRNTDSGNYDTKPTPLRPEYDEKDGHMKVVALGNTALWGYTMDSLVEGESGLVFTLPLQDGGFGLGFCKNPKIKN